MNRTYGRGNQNRGGGNIFKTMWLAFLLCVLVAMILLTLGILALRIGNFLPENTNVIFIVPKNHEFQVNDEENAWKNQAQVDLFRSSYVNGKNETTVFSQNGDKIIAPGTVSTYDFCAYNDGNMAMSYEIGFAFLLKLGEEVSDSSFPLSMRLFRANGEYLAGGENEWLPLAMGETWEYEGILGVDSYEQFILEIQWEFEGNDELDTKLGNQAAKSSVSLQLSIDTYAQAHSNPEAKGGVIVADGEWATSDGEYGGEIRWVLFVILIAATLALAAYIIWVA